MVPLQHVQIFCRIVSTSEREMAKRSTCTVREKVAVLAVKKRFQLYYRSAPPWGIGTRKLALPWGVCQRQMPDKCPGDGCIWNWSSHKIVDCFQRLFSFYHNSAVWSAKYNSKMQNERTLGTCWGQNTTIRFFHRSQMIFPSSRILTALKNVAVDLGGVRIRSRDFERRNNIFDIRSKTTHVVSFVENRLLIQSKNRVNLQNLKQRIFKKRSCQLIIGSQIT